MATSGFGKERFKLSSSYYPLPLSLMILTLHPIGNPTDEGHVDFLSPIVDEFEPSPTRSWSR